MPWGAAIAAVGAVAGSAISSSAAGDASDAQQASSAAALAQQQQQFNTTQKNLQPWLTAGGGALGKLSTLYGLNTTSGTASGAFNDNQPANVAAGTNAIQAATSAPTTVTDAYHQILGRDPDAAGLAYFSNLPLAQAISQIQGSAEAKQYAASGATNPYSAQGVASTAAPAAAATGTSATSSVDPNADFYLSPDYQFQLTQGLKGLTAKGSATNGTNNGAQQKAEIDYAGNLASGQYQNYKNGLLSLAGLGSGASSTAATTGQSNANSQSAITTNAGNNLASSYLGQGTIASNGINSVAGQLGSNSGSIGRYFTGQSLGDAPSLDYVNTQAPALSPIFGSPGSGF